MEGRPLDDAELIARARDGDIDAYDEIVLRYQGMAQRVAYAIIGDAADAEDAAQTAFVKAYYALARFKPDAPFRPWLLKIVSNEARNLRTASRRRAALAFHLAGGWSRDDAAPSPEAAASRREQHEALLAAMEELTEADRLVIAARYFLDLSETEMAETLGCPRGTVKSRLSRALGRLKQILVARGVETLDVEVVHE